MKDYSKYDYEERAKSQGETNFWEQVRRTINGEPVGQDQIELIYKNIKLSLNLKENDKLLDIGCGNGALTDYFTNDVESIVGIDRSDYLISIANKYFNKKNTDYICSDIADVRLNDIYSKVNKILIYGVFSFLNDDIATGFFENINKNKNIETIFIGNVRDRTLASKFYKREVEDSELDDCTSSMGKWRDKSFFEKIAYNFNWKVKFTKMPKEFYANEYYYDVTFSL